MREQWKISREWVFVRIAKCSAVGVEKENNMAIDIDQVSKTAKLNAIQKHEKNSFHQKIEEENMQHSKKVGYTEASWSQSMLNVLGRQHAHKNTQCSFHCQNWFKLSFV